MFDGTLNATIGDGAELDRLRARYDGLLADPPARPADEALAELAGMARIFDLDGSRPPAEVWRDLRAVLSRHGGPQTATPNAVPAQVPLTLMIVEDDPGMASDLTELLVGAGHGVVGPFPDAASAATVARRRSSERRRRIAPRTAARSSCDGRRDSRSARGRTGR